MGTAKATFAAGCFWRPQLQFRDVNGVIDATVGYTGGEVDQPTYEMVCTGGTGHAEAVDVTFDPDVVTYDQLLDFFFSIHDPTQVDRQGPDIGPQYRSAIFVHDESQRHAAQAAVERLQAQTGKAIATKIEEATDYWMAEDYHQWFLEKKGIRYQ